MSEHPTKVIGIQEAKTALVQTIVTVSEFCRAMAEDNSWSYADKAAAVLWQLTRALSNLERPE